MLVELVGGVFAGSLALVSDAAHMLTDVMALAIALAAIHIGRRRSEEEGHLDSPAATGFPIREAGARPSI